MIEWGAGEKKGKKIHFRDLDDRNCEGPAIGFACFQNGPR